MAVAMAKEVMVISHWLHWSTGGGRGGRGCWWSEWADKLGWGGNVSKSWLGMTQIPTQAPTGTIDSTFAASMRDT